MSKCARVFDVEDEVPRVPGLKMEHVHQMRAWLTKQPHLPNVPDQQLVLLLAAADSSIEKAKTIFEAHYTIKTHAPEFFKNRDIYDPDVQMALDTVELVVLPKTDPKGNRIVLGRLKNYEPAKYSFSACVKVLQLVMETHLREQGTAPGFIFVYDMKGVTVAHLGRTSLSAVRKYLVYVQEGVPIKMKGVHVINVNPVIDKFMNMIKPFMKKELISQLHFHSSGKDGTGDLYKYLPRDLFPQDYGGRQDSMHVLHNVMRSKIEMHREYFTYEETLRVDETKRPGKAKKALDIFGLEGSFKKLDID